MADYLTLIIGLAAFAVGCYLDFTSSMEMTRFGIKESTVLVASNGTFSPWKAIVFVIAPPVLVLIAFFAGHGVQGFDRFWAGLVLLPGAALHLWAYFHNRKLIRTKRNYQPGATVL